MYSNVIGIDPGQTSGAIALVSKHRLEVHDMPSDYRELKDLLEDLSLNANTICYIEEVHAYGVEGGPRSFNFGANFGDLRSTAHGVGIGIVFVRPQIWQKEFGLILPKNIDLEALGRRVGSKSKDKKRLKKKLNMQVAQDRFPTLAIEKSGHADALLIAEYGARQERVTLSQFS